MNNNNPLIEQFQNEYASKTNISSKEYWNAIPMIAFRTVSIGEWMNINSQISNNKRVINKEEGMQLCTFAICEIANDVGSDLKLEERTLNLGIKCLKSLFEINIDAKDNVSTEEKEKNKRESKAFLDFLKEWIKKSLKEEGKLL